MQDVIWGGGRGLVAGQNAMKNFVQSTRSAYPDMMIEAVDFATSDLEHGGKCAYSRPPAAAPTVCGTEFQL